MTTTITQLNACAADEFVRTVGPVFEHSPWIAQAAAEGRPFESRAALHAALGDIVLRAGREKQLALIRVHPELGGRAGLTGHSTREQAAAGLGQLTPEEVALFDRYNQEYKARFGMPFIICVRQHKKEVILSAFSERLNRTLDEEISTAVEQVLQIAALRLADLLP